MINEKRKSIVEFLGRARGMLTPTNVINGPLPLCLQTSHTTHPQLQLPIAHSVYKERPQTGTVFANKEDMDNLIDSLTWYSKSRKDRASQGKNRILAHRYKLRTYNPAVDEQHVNGGSNN